MIYKRAYKRVVEGVEQSRVVCDVCKRDVPRDGTWGRNEVEIEARLGDVYPENDLRERIWIDCCSSCFVQKVVPALESTLGVKFQRGNVDDELDDYAEWDPEAPSAEAT